MPMLDGVPMDIGDMRVEVLRVTDHMLPEAAPPDIALSLSADGFFRRAKSSGEAGFQQADSRGEVIVAIRKAPDKMRVLGQDNGGNCLKRMAPGDVRP